MTGNPEAIHLVENRLSDSWLVTVVKKTLHSPLLRIVFPWVDPGKPPVCRLGQEHSAVVGSGAGGRRFESSLPDHLKPAKLKP
jgi:hypothetical protein